jgi:adhesin/invasin
VSPVVGITLTAGQTSLPADGASSTTITAALITPSGGPVDDGTAVTFTTDIGRFNVSGAKTITTTATGSSGSVVVPFISEAGVAGIATILATAQDIIQKLAIEFVAVAPQSPTTQVAGILLQADSAALVANGTSSTFITAALITSTGDVAGDGVTVNFTTDLGRFTVDGAKTAAASTSGGTGTVLVQFMSEKDIVGTATIVANVGGIAQSIQIALTGAGDPATILLEADSTTISIFGTTGITAQVLDDEGNPVDDGTAVSFTTSLTGTGVTPVATTGGGIATAVFSAGTSAGVATVTARAGSVSAVISITIQAGPAGSLEFVSADPILIGVRGSALPQKSTITFRVRDVNGNPAAEGTQVTFTLISGLGGGETVAPTIVGTVAGLASTVLTSGTVSGPVRVLASVTVGATTLTSSSTNVSITGGPPSGAHIGVAPSFRNIAGLVTQGIICPVTAIVGDRFGNPVPQNTTVSFFTNGGVVAPQGLTDELGNAPSEIKTGPPTPRAGSTPDPGPSDPRTGFVTIIAVTQGEETFIDSDGDGVFDGPGEFDPTDPEIDTPEAFIDQVNLCNGLPFPAPCPADPLVPPFLSGDGVFDPNNRFELFIDANGNGIWDVPNGVWDANKPIFATTTVLFTGPTQLAVGELQNDGTCSLGVPLGFDVPDGGSSQPFCFIVSDPAGRPLVGGTRITVTTSAGAISGTSNVILPDTQRGGPGITFFAFAVVDDDPGDDDPAADALVTVSVVSPISATCPGGNGDLAVSFSGSVD